MLPSLQQAREAQGDAVQEVEGVNPWTNFSLQDEPWAEFTTLEVAACTYCPL